MNLKSVKDKVIKVRPDEFIEDSEENAPFERILPKLGTVAAHLIPDKVILDQKSNLFDLSILKLHFFNQGKLSLKQLSLLLKTSSEITILEPNLLLIDGPTYVIGDTHGQFYDLMTILDEIDISNLKHNVLFLGDYVDRGSFSVEVYLFLMLLKTHYPKQVFILRGNHESLSMTSYFTFKSEVTSKYGIEAYDLFLNSFNTLPICAIIQNDIFCSHGGIPSKFKNIYDIDKIDRFREIPTNGPICDLLWSDPNPKFTTKSSFIPNHQRNCSVFYSYNDVINFLKNNNLKGIFRAHEVQEEGIKFLDNYNNFPSVTILFSAPNYCDIYNNTGCFILYDKKIKKVFNVDAVKHPFILPNFQNGISWSLPFIVEKSLLYAFDFSDSISTLMNFLTSSSSTSTTNVIQAELLESTTTNLTRIEEVIEKEVDKEEVLKKVVLLRSERENIDEFIDEESAVDCCALHLTEPEIETYDEAVDADKKNEQVKKKKDIELIEELQDVPPSLLTQNLKDLENLNDLELNKDKSDNYNLITSNENDKEIINDDKEIKEMSKLLNEKLNLKNEEQNLKSKKNPKNDDSDLDSTNKGKFMNLF
ncbi:PP2BA [Hepatospora eriocheir]|uniref:Serine/threonine-protein phosphatase n=1 Tax=Hepatospora eriocheir TaxID=1081669 RepID=A0A1X0QLI4_9MICR|nr:PP2BA [Hepatospora eriocheir]